MDGIGHIIECDRCEGLKHINVDAGCGCCYVSESCPSCGGVGSIVRPLSLYERFVLVGQGLEEAYANAEDDAEASLIELSIEQLTNAAFNALGMVQFGQFQQERKGV